MLRQILREENNEVLNFIKTVREFNHTMIIGTLGGSSSSSSRRTDRWVHFQQNAGL